jgi:hypothetical protein
VDFLAERLLHAIYEVSIAEHILINLTEARMFAEDLEAYKTQEEAEE